MFMKNIDVIVMYNCGVLNITNHDLDAKNAYKVLKFRNAISKAYDEIKELELSILKDCDIKDVDAINNKIRTLQNNKERTPDEEAELTSLMEKVDNYNKTRSEMLNDSAKIGDLKPLSYENWHILRKENRPKKEGDLDPLNNYVENVLENVMWVAPEDNE